MESSNRVGRLVRTSDGYVWIPLAAEPELKLERQADPYRHSGPLTLLSVLILAGVVVAAGFGVVAILTRGY